MLIFVVAIFSCNKKNDEFKLKNKIIGNWIIDGIPYSKTNLEIFPDNTFRYSESNHLTNSFSRGTWQIEENLLILNSFLFNKECIYVTEFNQPCKEESNIDKNIVIKPAIELQTTIKNCKPKSITKFYKKFENSKFYIDNKSLKFIQNNSCKEYYFKFYIHR